ncbi:hypothetical protein V8E36_007291 [Tilletia maclaganii]
MAGRGGKEAAVPKSTPTFTRTSTTFPVRSRAPTTLSSIFEQQKFGYDRRKGTVHSSGKLSLAVRSKAGRRAHAVGDGQWPQGLIDTAADQAGPAATGDTGVGSDVNAQEPDDWTMWDGDHGGLDIDTFAGSEPAITNPFFAQDETEGMEHDVDDYAAAVFKYHTACCVRITPETWALEGWRTGCPEIGFFYHLSVLVLPDVFSISCDCPSFRSRGTCIHHDLFMGNWDSLREMNTLDPSGSPSAVEIAQLLHGRLHWLSVLAQDTAQSAAAPGMHKRCIVSSLTSREWECSGPSCRRGLLGADACIHRARASKYLKEMYGIHAFDTLDVVAEDASTGTSQLGK